jgi:hypothetical protein
MQCPACKTENEADRTTCRHCRANLPAAAAPPPKRRSRARGSEKKADVPISPEAERANRAVYRAYQLCLIGLLPFAGLLLGPLSAVLAWHGARRVADDPGFSAQPYAAAAIVLGILSGITNWVGLTLMILGLYLK